MITSCSSPSFRRRPGQSNATLIEPLKIVVTSGGNVQAYDWDLPIAGQIPLYDELLDDLTDDFEIRFGVGIKDAGYTD
jgi:hypothetical protein